MNHTSAPPRSDPPHSPLSSPRRDNASPNARPAPSSSPRLSREAIVELIVIWLAAATSASLTLLAAARATPQHPMLEANPLAAAYLSVSPLAFVAMKLAGLLCCTIGLVRAHPHVPRLDTWLLRSMPLAVNSSASVLRGNALTAIMAQR